MEQRLETPAKFQHPYYEVLTWFAAQNLLKEIKGVLVSEQIHMHASVIKLSLAAFCTVTL